MADTANLATCYAGDQLFGIEVAQVQEVTRGGSLTRMPLASPAVCGLLNLRGQVLVAIDLRICLGLIERPAADVPVHVVLKTEAGSVSLLVDRVGDVLALDENAFERPPDTMRGRIRELIRGVYQLETGLLLALDTDKVLNEMKWTSDMGERA